jgi:hypothetical protein
MDAANVTSIIALTISAFSAALTVFSHLRDRPRIIAWSEVVYDRSKDPENPPPCFYLKIVNAGRRPIIITSIEKKSKETSWTNGIVEADLGREIFTHITEEDWKKMCSTEHSSKVLKESEFFEAAYEGDDFLAQICDFSGDKFSKADRLFVIDIFGRSYPVRNSKKHITQMLGSK